jgi:hypothetical protein
MPHAQSADGVIHDFPEGTDPGVMDRVMKEYASKQTPQSTSLGGLEGSLTRGIAPMAVGAGLGAVLGAPFGGVGAIPGAAAGAGAVGLTELTTGIYNKVAHHFGWPETATPQEMTDKVLDLVGVKRPSTGVERTAEAVAGGAAGALGPARAAETVAGLATSPTIKGVAGSLAERPGLQTASGALGGAAAQGATEAGLGTAGQIGAGLVGGALPYGKASLAADPRRMAMEARQAGYVLPPNAFSERPGVVSTALSGWGGKIKTQQQASAKNAEVTNQLAAKALGLPPDTVMSDQVFKQVRQDASREYRNVATSIPSMIADPVYDQTISQLGGVSAQLQQAFPKITKNQAIDDLKTELQGVRQMTPDMALELVRELRFGASRYMRAGDDPSKQALGIAMRQAANAVDDLLERNISAQTGRTDLVDKYRAARQLIARSHDVELATNPATGDVNARVLGRLKVADKPLTGELEQIANTSLAFPKATQPPASFGHVEPLSVFDVIGAGAGVAAGHPGVAELLLARPAARATVLSQPYQRAMSSTAPPPGPLPLIMNPGALSAVPTDADTMRRAASP